LWVPQLGQVKRREYAAASRDTSQISTAVAWAKALPVYTFDLEFGRHGVPAASP